MAKILLVEDDKSLREIYGVRLQAEGYEIVSAGDGEEALAMAIKERPDLIVSDVMMPKISGFDMLDILRSTTETKDVKVIMMTALSSDDQRARGEALGADRYLVKSQVGIEDVVRTVHDVLGDGAAGFAPAATPETATPDLVTPAPETMTSTPPSTPVTPPNPYTSAPPTSSPSPTPLSSPPQPQPFDAPAAPASLETIGTPPTIAPDPVPTAPAPTLDQEPVQPTPDSAISSQNPYAAPPSPTPMPEPSPISSNPVINMPPEIPAAPAPMAAPVPTPTPESPLPQPTAPFSSPGPASLSDRVINPISPQDTGVQRPPNMGDLMSQELANSDNNLSQQTPPPPPPPPMPGQ